MEALRQGGGPLSDSLAYGERLSFLTYCMCCRIKAPVKLLTLQFTADVDWVRGAWLGVAYLHLSAPVFNPRDSQLLMSWLPVSFYNQWPEEGSLEPSLDWKRETSSCCLFLHQMISLTVA